MPSRSGAVNSSDAENLTIKYSLHDLIVARVRPHPNLRRAIFGMPLQIYRAYDYRLRMPAFD